jgi:hypothetical protein
LRSLPDALNAIIWSILYLRQKLADTLAQSNAIKAWPITP